MVAAILVVWLGLASAGFQIVGLHADGFVGALAPAVAQAASPSPSEGSGDVRSPGEGPGFVGAPLLAIAGVLGVGLVAVLATTAYVKATEGRRATQTESRSPGTRPRR